MRKSLKLALRQSEIRQRLNELLALDTRTDDQDTELETLTTEAQRLEPELRAALVAEAEADQAADNAFRNGNAPENVELRGLVRDSSLAEIVAAAVERRSTGGQTAELQSHFGLTGSQVPLAMLRESRAVTTVPSDAGADQAEIVQPVFAMGDLTHMAVMQETVPVGDSVYPVLTTAPDVKGPFTDSSTASETNGVFKASTLAPERSQASFSLRRGDAMRFDMMEDALRMALTSALSEELDKLWMAQMVKASNAGGLGNATDLASGKAAAADIRKLGGGQVDGRYASGKADIRVLMGATTYGLADTLYPSNGDMSAVDSLQAETGGVRVSPHVAAVASKKQDSFIRLGSRRDGVTAVWDGVSLVYDEVTKAATGEIVLTAVMFSARAILRTGAFKRIAVQTAA